MASNLWLPDHRGHAYLDLQHEQVWEIIEVYLPELKAVVYNEIARLE